ncbi:hypothetical protein LMG18090_04393 [Ralstonia mannitolilytica]|uniref:hypothetical protein n=1 Tax=Ralstonia mannitolilytica TaxID=105219 RepID=UPI0028F54C5D|nr:hypothetical protein [Ralstonia mannitolilytica]CAJ0803118.1 hypothetical protein LMG18090_04393 [Ralstonia mannitolilytica]
MAEQQWNTWPFPRDNAREQRQIDFLAKLRKNANSHVEPAELGTPTDVVVFEQAPVAGTPLNLGPHTSHARARAFPAANCNVLALDLGTQCGWAVATRDGKFISGSDRFDPKRCGGPGRRWLAFREFLTARAREAGGIQALYYEDVKAHGPGVQAAHVYGGFLAVLELWCAANNIPLYGVGVGTIKKHATGKGNAKKPDMIAAAKARGIAAKDDNEADAVALLAYALEQER